MNFRIWAFAAALVLLAGCGDKQPIRYDGKTVTAAGWSGDKTADFARVLKVYASTDPDAPPVAGDYERHGSKIVFKPRFKPAPSITLRAVYLQADGSVATAIFPGKGGAVVAASTKVTAVYPTDEVWPANVLKLYIQFSAPMSQGQAWSHIHLLDDQGRPISKPFVEIDQELWSPGGDRLTVLFDPGRIKRGLTDHDTDGPPLVSGRHYTLKIDKDWADAAGVALAAGFERAITAGPDVRLPVEPASWTINTPARNEALIIEFPRPLDNALARTMISVRQGANTVKGQVTLDANETRWTFVPDRAWTPGAYQLRVQGVLEDLAGNRVRRLFDVDTSDKTQTVPPPASVDLPFLVK